MNMILSQEARVLARKASDLTDTESTGYQLLVETDSYSVFIEIQKDSRNKRYAIYVAPEDGDAEWIYTSSLDYIELYRIILDTRDRYIN